MFNQWNINCFFDKKTSTAKRYNNICNHLYFTEIGIARSYYHKDGKDITANFSVKNGGITAIDSFIQRKKVVII